MSNKFDAIGLDNESSTSPLLASNAEINKSGTEDAAAANIKATNIIFSKPNPPSKFKNERYEGNLPVKRISHEYTKNRHQIDILKTLNRILFQDLLLLSL